MSTEKLNDFEQQFAEEVRRAEKRRRVITTIVFILLLDAVLIPSGLFWYFALPPERVGDVTVNIPEGDTVREIGYLLESKKVIRSHEVFQGIVRLRGVDTALPSGIFLFPSGESVFAVIDRLVTQKRGIERVRATIPEGLTTAQIAIELAKDLPEFDINTFTDLADAKGSYIFPDTYFFYTTATSGEVYQIMRENFQTKTAELRMEALASGKNWDDIVIMASLIEEEAVDDEDRKLVSGILWNRIKLGMRLQVDASFAYLLGKSSSEITETDLAMDSPYNTYRYAGLPPGPIAHPGLATIDAALHPTDTPYLYYLSDENGTMHYAKTFAEHKVNKEKYLR